MDARQRKLVRQGTQALRLQIRATDNFTRILRGTDNTRGVIQVVDEFAHTLQALKKPDAALSPCCSAETTRMTIDGTVTVWLCVECSQPVS